jgi:hypothetical protein
MYRNQAKASGGDADLERLDNLDELVSSARQFEMEFDAMADPAAETEEMDSLARPLDRTPPLLAMLRAYLESIALVADADAVDPANGSVTLMTLHAAKGLEFRAVAIIGLEEGQLPHSRARESQAELEEERRLCFVGITRAMQRLHLTSSRYRTLRGIPERTIPSRFIEEIPKDSVLISDQADALGGLEDFVERAGRTFEPEGEFAPKRGVGGREGGKRAKIAWGDSGLSTPASDASFATRSSARAKSSISRPEPTPGPPSASGARASRRSSSNTRASRA